VRPGPRTKASVPLVLPQNRHPERSASQIDHVTQRLWRGVKGLGDAYLPHGARSSPTTEARQQDLLRYALDGHGFSAPGKDRGGQARCRLGG
jgi:hypothetical protein